MLALDLSLTIANSKTRLVIGLSMPGVDSLIAAFETVQALLEMIFKIISLIFCTILFYSVREPEEQHCPLIKFVY